MKKALLTGLLTISIGFNAWAGGSKLTLSKGTMQLGGVTSLQMDMYIPEGDADSQSGFILKLSPEVGYFLMDNLELLATVDVQVPFGDLYDGADKDITFGVGGKYYIPMDSMVPYLGLEVGMRFLVPDEGDSYKWLGIRAPLGLLIPLNEWVAVDLGIEVQYAMGMDDQGSIFGLLGGYLGVQAFF